MARPLLLALLLATSAVLGGCLAPAGTPNANGPDVGSALQFLAGAPLWADPQNTPHPAFGWPTLSSPTNATNAPAWWKPIPALALPTPIKGLDQVGQSPEEIRSGAGIALFGSLAIVPGFGKPTGILDISDPTHPKLLSTFKPQEGMTSHRGATTIAYPDGRLVTVISTGAGLDVWDITDPTNPQPLPPIKVKSHKVGVVPGTPIVYNAGSGGGGQGTGQTEQTATGVTQIYDLSDPMNATKVQDWKNGFACHHVYFWNDVAHDKYRGICAGIQYTQLWDTKDPRDPKVIVSVPVHHGVAGTPSASVGTVDFSHYAGLSRDGKILLVGDENGGGGTPPGCVASANTPAGAVSTPIGALWFYDVSNEKNPRVLGWYSPLNDPRMKPAPAMSCTAHHGRLVPAEGRDMVAMSFYGAGVVLVDFTGVGSPGGPLPNVVDQWAQGSDTWETWYNQGYLFTGDLARGLDVLKFT
jgi:hypothetical protein